jgi:Tol biopolymer transport system component
MKTINCLLMFLIFIILLFSTACGPSAPQPTPPHQIDTIAFSKYTSETKTEEDIYSIQTDGTELKLLAHEPGVFLEHPVWSPDGTRIAFHSGTGDLSTYSIWSMNADGSAKLQLTQPPLFGMFPAWSPDGKLIAFSGRSEGEYWLHLHVMNADGSELRNVANGEFDVIPGANCEDFFPAWTSDGKLLFLRLPRHIILGEVYSIMPDGSDLTQLTQNESLKGFALSPDGKNLAVFKGATHKIAVHPIEAPGNEVLLIDSFFDCDNVKLSWAPDGSKIALACSDYIYYLGPSALTIINADGSGLKQVTEAGLIFDPAWKP